MTELKNKQCPFCGEYIPLDSEICKYCKESLVNNIETRSTYQEKGTNEVVQPDSEEKRTHTKTRLSYVLFLILSTIVGGVLVLGMFFVVHRNIDVGFATNEQVKARPHILSKANNGNLEKAKQLYKEGHIDESAQLFQNEIDSSNDPTAYYYMGEIYREQGFSKIAISNYNKALENKKGFYEPLKRLAEVYLDKYENDKALEYATKAIKMHPNDVELLKTIAQIYQNMGNSDKLLEIYKKIATLDKKDYSSNYYLANYYYQSEKYKEAIPYLNNLINTEYNTDLAYSLAISYSQIEYYTKAMEILDLIIKKDPYEYYSATYAKSRLSDMKDYYNSTHKKTPVKKVSTTKPKNETQKNDYTEEAENALF